MIDTTNIHSGTKVTCTIEGDFIGDAVLVREADGVYLCQNVKDGSKCTDMYGYAFSWIIMGDGSVTTITVVDARPDISKEVAEAIEVIENNGFKAIYEGI